MLHECWILELGYPIGWVWLLEKFQIEDSQESFYTPLGKWGSPNSEKHKGCPLSLENMNDDFLLNVNIYYTMTWFLMTASCFITWI